jgi:hypothetical protein
MVHELKLFTSCFYDDKFGFEVAPLMKLAFGLVQFVHRAVGVLFSKDKLQCGSRVDILGVHYNLDDMSLAVKESRKVELLEQIRDILKTDQLHPSTAAKLKGKLQFASSQFWGRVGGHFMLALSERQYSKSGQVPLTKPLVLALMQWVEILREGRPRSLAPPKECSTEVVVFTDGYTPDPRFQEEGDSMVGVAIFQRGSAPLFMSEVVHPDVMARWIPRKTQIALVELFAPVLALAACHDWVANKRTLVFIDSDSALGALVKGYSGRADICELTGLFWTLVRKLDALVYLDRVPTDMNPADLPSRGKVRQCIEMGWKRREFGVHQLGKQGLGEASIPLWGGGVVTTGCVK